MKQSIFLYALLFFTLGTLAQTPLDVINPSQFNQKLLEQMVQFKVNEYRKDNGLKPMLFSQQLYMMAKDQADYIKVKDELTHNQTIKGKETVADRLKYYTKSSNFSVAENIARTFILIPTYNYDNQGEKKLSTAKTYEEAATYMLNSWKQSQVHNKNMLNQDFSTTALYIYFNTQDKSLTAVQVFANYR